MQVEKIVEENVEELNEGWNIEIEEVGALNANNDGEETVFYRSCSSCTCTC